MHVEDEIANILAKKHGNVRSVNIWYRYRMGRIFQCTRQKIESVRAVFIALITALVLCAGSQDLLLSVSVRRVHIVS